MKKDFESLFNYFNALTDSEDVKLADFVEWRGLFVCDVVRHKLTIDKSINI
jgi:hypothetical protein